jgi:adenosylmethionine-8-amino-7-oxononanoate aminotransferase
MAEIAPGDLSGTFFVSSGSEAVETVIKLARQYHKANGEPTRYKVISRKIAYHGTTMGALSVTGLPSFKAPFEPLLQGFHHVPEHPAGPRGGGGGHRGGHRVRAAGDGGGGDPGARAERGRMPGAAARLLAQGA